MQSSAQAATAYGVARKDDEDERVKKAKQLLTLNAGSKQQSTKKQNRLHPENDAAAGWKGDEWTNSFKK